MSKFFLIIVTLFYSLNSYADQRPEAVVEQFYNWRFKAAFTGVPKAPEMKKAKQFLSSELVCLLNAARTYQERFAKKFPDDKPPFIEGDMFTSLFEGANRYTLEPIHVMKTAATAQLHFYHDQGETVDKKGWNDKVVLQKKNNEWRISDIQYGGQFEFGNSGSLRQNLLDELSKDSPELHWKGRAQLKSCR
jgi:hypothetical protein